VTAPGTTGMSFVAAEEAVLSKLNAVRVVIEPFNKSLII